ncbi:MAG: PRC-barrel domain-containing protein [Anaerolineae bacterium]|jgi:sporulation protein YlmC with PRC-barrel domain
MRLGKDLISKPIISITDGRLLGTVKDLYLNDQLYWLTGIHVGTEGLLKRKNFLIPRDSVVVFGLDAVLVKNADVITEDKDLVESETWPRLSKLKGREIDTPGGTKVGAIGDIVISEEGHITGFTLAKVFVEGPVAEQGQIPRETLIDTGNEDGVMTIDLPKVERLLQDLPDTNV